MTTSILTSTKKVLGLAEDYTAFDIDIILHINGVFSTLNDLGIGPEDGFMIENDEATWESYLGDSLQFNSVKNYVYLKTRVVFDPPQTSFALAAIQEQIKELEWRLNVQREKFAWVDPNPDPELNPVCEEFCLPDTDVVDGLVIEPL